MARTRIVQKIRNLRRYVRPAKSGDKDLGPLKLLPGTWANVRKDKKGKPTDGPLPGRGWNIIALPFAKGKFNYRVLMNQYNEELVFTTVDKGVPNRGIKDYRNSKRQSDQFVVTLDYQQKIDQIAAQDFPESGEAGKPGLPIHHEPGLFLHMLNEQTDKLDIARLATIPHGDAALGLGCSKTGGGGPKIPKRVSALPIGVEPIVTDCDTNCDDNGKKKKKNPYLAPYQHFTDFPFRGVVPPPFPGFLPEDTTALLHAANEGVDIKRTTTLDLDTELETGGIHNIPFIVKQANAASMKSTFWIQELAERDPKTKKPILRLQYLQVVMLDFFPRPDGMPGPIRWPHISINTMEKIAEPKKA